MYSGRLRALIFDVDGTLADTEEVHRQAFNATFLDMGLGWEWSRALYRELLEISGGKERLAHFISSLPLTGDQRESILERISMIHRIKTQRYEERIEHGNLAFRQGVLRLLTEARAAGLRLAIATTSTLANVHALIDSAWGVNRIAWFDAVGAGDLVEHKKPAPDIYELVLSTLRVPADSCVAFEDSVNGLRSAISAGLATVVTPTQWNDDHQFAGASLVLPHLGDERHPLDAATSNRLGATMLGLSQIEALLDGQQAGK